MGTVQIEFFAKWSATRYVSIHWGSDEMYHLKNKEYKTLSDVETSLNAWWWLYILTNGEDPVLPFHWTLYSFIRAFIKIAIPHVLL